MRRKPFLLLAALFSAAALSAVPAWMIADRAEILRDGREIVLKSEPVDPRDLLRGRYVALNYSISSIPGALFGLGRGETIDDGETVYVELAEGPDGYWIATAVRTDMPPGEGGQTVWIRGKTRHGVYSGTQTSLIEYGIERFYVPEPDAPEIEKRMRNGTVTDIVVAVGADGRAQIKALRQGDTTIFTERLF